MSRSFLHALKKVGLVEIEDDTPAVAAASEVAPSAQDAAPTPDAVATVDTEVVEKLPLDQIYAQGNVPASPYPAEKLLKLLDGLRTMDANVRKAAITAMDAADDSWTIEDVLLDVDRKIKALEARKALLAAQARAADVQAKAEVSAREQKQQEAVASIRQQIADLQALMEREVEKATADKSAAQARAKTAQDASTRESARLDEEINRLREIPNTFAAPGAG
jgi:chromosome segregation ATPase